MASPLQRGAKAPDFCLAATADQKVSLDDFKGSSLVLAFYPADWSPVCSDELTVYNELLPEFRHLGAQLVGISVDGPWCHNAFAAHSKYRFPLLSDFEPKGDVARAYGVYRPRDGVSERALFVVDRDRIIQWSYVSPIGVNPGADGVLEALESMQSQKEQPHDDAKSSPY